MSKYHKLGKTCAACAKPITDQNTKGECRSCWLANLNRDPEVNARRNATKRRTCGPGGKHYATFRALMDKARASRDPVKLREQARKMREAFAPADPRWREAHAAAMRARRHQWLPEEYRELYYKMLRLGVKNGGFRAWEAKRIIRRQVEADKRRAMRQAGAEERDTAEAILDAQNGSRKLLAALTQANG